MCRKRKTQGQSMVLNAEIALVLLSMELTCREGVQGYCLPRAELTVTSARCSCALHGTSKG